MRNPVSLYDSYMTKEEPLRSFLRRTTPNDSECDELAQELSKKHPHVIKTWLEFSFPAADAPIGEPLRADHTSAMLFIQFYESLHTGGQTGARTYLDKEKARRNWPRTTAERNQSKISKHCGKTEDEATGRRKSTAPIGKNEKHAVHASSTSRPINPPTSHVPPKNKHHRFPRTADAKSAINTTCDKITRAKKYNNTHAVHTLTTPAHSQSAISLMAMDVSPTIPQKRPSSSLSERKDKRRITSDTHAIEVKGTRGYSFTSDPRDSLLPTSTPKRSVQGKTTSSLNQVQCPGLEGNRRSSRLQSSTLKERRTSTRAPQIMSTQESRTLKRKESPVPISGQGSSQVKAFTDEAVAGTMKKYLKTRKPYGSRQREKHSGASTKSVSIAIATGVDLETEAMETSCIISNPRTVLNTSTPKKMKGLASAKTRPQSALDQEGNLRKSSRNSKTYVQDSTAVGLPLSSSGNGRIPVSRSPANNLRSRKSIESVLGPTANGSPATNLRSRRNNEVISTASDNHVSLKRKRTHSLDTNTKTVRAKTETAAQRSKCKPIVKSDLAGGVTGKIASTSKTSRRQSVNKGHVNPEISRIHSDSSVQLSYALPVARVSGKPALEIEKTRGQLSKKVSEVASAPCPPIKVAGTIPSLDNTTEVPVAVTATTLRNNAPGIQVKKKKKKNRAERRLSSRFKNLNGSKSHTEYEANCDINFGTDAVFASEETKLQPPYETTAILQADVATKLPESTIPTVANEHANIGAIGYLESLPESIDATMKPTTVLSRTSDTLFSPPSVNDNRAVIVSSIEEDVPDLSQILSSSKCLTVLPPQKTAEDKDIAMDHYEETNSSAEYLDHLDAEDVVEPQHLGDHLDTLCRFPKPPLRFLPPLWAESRQEICESFDWFRSYQGGVYHAHNVAKGYLLGAFPSSRDRFEHGGRLIISHGGGKAESIHSKQGHLSSQPATDQLAQDKSVRALMNNYQNNRPLALLMDDRYFLFPYDLKARNVAYAVLGFYTISDAWAEYQPSNNESGRVVRYKFAFRWCDQQGSPWWEDKDGEDVSSHLRHTESISASDTPTVVSLESSPSITISPNLEHVSTVAGKEESFRPVENGREHTKHACSSCSRVFLQIFDLCWTCLNADCVMFCKRPNGSYLPDRLEYSSSFLELVPSKPIPTGFGNLMPESVLPLPLKTGTTYAFTRGFHCGGCGRLSCRYQWEQWECRNCKRSVDASYAPREAMALMYQTPSTTFKDHSLNVISEITQLPPKSYRHEHGRGMVQTFVLPHNSAMIHHIQPGNSLGRKEADSIFLDYQTQATSGALKFRRLPMRAHKCRGSLLTNYFSQNSGAPYKYVGGDANTVPFDRAPGAVIRARDLIQKRIMQALSVPAQFNEVLSAAYMERQKMAFHSDNERGLGPLVAGLSLGSPALMHFRLLAKHDPGREKRGILLSIVLRHGDVLVMDGNAVQDYYEHTVVPTNFRIAATARQINADHA